MSATLHKARENTEGAVYAGSHPHLCACGSLGASAATPPAMVSWIAPEMRSSNNQREIQQVLRGTVQMILRLKKCRQILSASVEVACTNDSDWL
jgi:hypothetical protein